MVNLKFLKNKLIFVPFVSGMIKIKLKIIVISIIKELINYGKINVKLLF